MSKRFIEIQKKFPPVPLTEEETLILQEYEKNFEESMKNNDIRGVFENPPYPYHKKQFWRKLQWMTIDVEIKIQSLEQHAANFLERYQQNQNSEDFSRYCQLIAIVNIYKEKGFCREMFLALYQAKNPIPKKLFPYEMGRIWIMDACLYGFEEDFLIAEQNLTKLQKDLHNNIIQEKLRDQLED